VEWFLTKESGCAPAVCVGFSALVERCEGVLGRRVGRSVFVVKAVGQTGQWEVVCVPLSGSTVEWFEENVLPSLLQHVREGSWQKVVGVVCYLTCMPSCLQGCQGDCSCVERSLWTGSGWRRIPEPEWHVPRCVRWWSGFTDAVGEVCAEVGPWLRCPCGLHVVSGRGGT